MDYWYIITLIDMLAGEDIKIVLILLLLWFSFPAVKSSFQGNRIILEYLHFNCFAL